MLNVARGDYPAALDAYRESLPLHESLGHTPDIAGTLVNMAIAWRLQGNNRLALEYHQKGLAMAERTGNQQVIAEALSQTGQLYASQGQTAIALEHYQKALAINEAMGRRGEAALQQSYIAGVLAGRGEIDAALALHAAGAEDEGGDWGSLHRRGILEQHRLPARAARRPRARARVLDDESAAARGSGEPSGDGQRRDAVVTRGEPAEAIMPARWRPRNARSA